MLRQRLYDPIASTLSQLRGMEEVDGYIEEMRGSSSHSSDAISLGVQKLQRDADAAGKPSAYS